MGYSEFSAAVLEQGPGVVELFGESVLEACVGTRLDEVLQAGLVHRHATLEDVAEARGLPLGALRRAVEAAAAAAAAGTADAFGRLWPPGSPRPLAAPFHSIRVRGALFHTQGGLRVDGRGRVLAARGRGPLPGLLAAGGAAAGVSGDTVGGYLSGNGLLTAAVYGRAAGEEAAAIRLGAPPEARL